MIAIRVFLVLISVFAFSANALASPYSSKRVKPLKYNLHKTEIKALVHYFDSVCAGQKIGFGLSSNKDEVHLINYSSHADQFIKINNQISKDSLAKFHLNITDVNYIKQALKKAKCCSIKISYSNTSRAIELILNQNTFSDNCKGLIFITLKTDRSVFPAYYKTINNTTLFYKHLSYL